MSRNKTGKHLNCAICNKLVYVPKARISSFKYCSNECKNNSMIGKIPWNKSLTKNDDYRLKNISEKAKIQMINEYKNNLRDKFKITKEANKQSRKKGLDRFKDNPNYRIGKRGYVLIYIPALLNDKKGGEWKKYHRYVWEQKYGVIPDDYDIHHKDNNKLNNNISNLQLVTKSEHQKLHPKERDSNGRFINH